MRVTKSIIRGVAGLLVLAACSSEAAERRFLRATVEPGGEVLVRGHMNWDKVCRPLPAPIIKIARHPTNGTVAIRPGTFAVTPKSWHPDAQGTCPGRSFPGLGIYYRANRTFRGVDTFEYEVTAGYRNWLLAFAVDVEVTVEQTEAAPEAIKKNH